MQSPLLVMAETEAEFLPSEEGPACAPAVMQEAVS